MCHQEVLDFFDKKRTTIIAWRKSRNFPEPISKSPLRWIRAAVMEWVEHEGGFKVG
ncbi:helix-turn-helix transcriptional regulator [Vibrio sp. NH-UV-68]|uniref:helix-turn-helix transcriptional regulator n=1 Tax=unclassified Vibrio TaxID=2614977 RepID=UPI0036F30736